MICPVCHSDAKLKVERTCCAGPAGKTQEVVCTACNTRFTALTLLLVNLDLEPKPRGLGARAVAAKLRRLYEGDDG